MKVVNLVIKDPEAGMAANTKDVLAETYAAAGSLVSCVMTETTTLEGKKWSELPMHCEIEITDSLAGLFGAFVAGTDLPTVTTFAAVADTPLGDKSITGTFDSSDTTDVRAIPQPLGESEARCLRARRHWPCSLVPPHFDLGVCSGVQVPTYQMEAGCAAPSAFEGNMHLAGYSTHTCWTPGSATFNAILGTCDVTAAIGNDANGELIDFGSGEGTNLGEQRATPPSLALPRRRHRRPAAAAMPCATPPLLLVASDTSTRARFFVRAQATTTSARSSAAS